MTKWQPARAEPSLARAMPSRESLRALERLKMTSPRAWRRGGKRSRRRSRHAPSTSLREGTEWKIAYINKVKIFFRSFPSKRGCLIYTTPGVLFYLQYLCLVILLKHREPASRPSLNHSARMARNATLHRRTTTPAAAGDSQTAPPSILVRTTCLCPPVYLT